MKIKTIWLMKMTTATHPTASHRPWPQRTQVPGRASISIRRRTVLLGHPAQVTAWEAMATETTNGSTEPSLRIRTGRWSLVVLGKVMKVAGFKIDLKSSTRILEWLDVR